MAEWNRDTPWRQGHLLDEGAIKALGLYREDIADRMLVIVASHDCDLAQAPEGGEPAVEFIVGRLVTEKDGNYTHAKSPRKLHVEFSGATTFWGEFEAIDKVAIGKSALLSFSPRVDSQLSPENRTIFQQWLASRYRRSAFPDEFEKRLTAKEFKLHEKIAKAVKPHGELIIGVFFDVDEGNEVVRNGPQDTYTLDITILHAADPDFDIAEAAANTAAEDIKKAFKAKLFDSTKKWQQIELRFCEPVSESVLTYQQFKQLRRWRLDYISLAAEPQQSLLAE